MLGVPLESSDEVVSEEKEMCRKCFSAYEQCAAALLRSLKDKACVAKEKFGFDVLSIPSLTTRDTQPPSKHTAAASSS